jgi:RNA polymerase sigma factor (sigma-70 family)
MISLATKERQLTYGYGKTRLTDEQSKLVADNLRLCYNMMKRYSTIPPELWDEMIAEAALPGLMRAARNFDPNNGAKFSTFACWCIRKEINRHYTKGQTYAHRFQQVFGDFDDDNGYSIESLVDERRQANPDLDNETKAHVLDLLKHIHGVQRQVIELRYFHGMTLREIGLIFGHNNKEWARAIEKDALATMRLFS